MGYQNDLSHKSLREQLIDIAILVGTDYNDRVPRIGPKTALKLVKQHGNLEKIIAEKGFEITFPYEEIRQIFLNPPTIDLVEPTWSEPNAEAIRKILCTEHDFSIDRVNRTLERLEQARAKLDEPAQSSLSDFF